MKRQLSNVICDLIETMQAQGATNAQIKRAAGETIDLLKLKDVNRYHYRKCDPVKLKSFPVSVCPDCGIVQPY
jgi:hypothetical protein